MDNLQTLDDQEGVSNEVYHRFNVQVAPCTHKDPKKNCQDESSYEQNSPVEVFAYQITQKRLSLAPGIGH